MIPSNPNRSNKAFDGHAHAQLRRARTERDEARDLAKALYAAVHELVDNLGELVEINPLLDPDGRLPRWLTGAAADPDTWQRDDEDDEQ